MTDLQKAMATMIAVFDKYASKDGKNDTLSKSEVKTLLEKELPELIKGAKNPGEVDKLIKDLDFNGDAEVDFTEFAILVATLSCAIHGCFAKK